MNMNTTCLKVEAAGIELAEARTVWTGRLIVHILACTMIGMMSLAGLLWLGILVAGLVHSVGATH